MKKINVHVVPHSHWDREWYFTLEDSSVILIEQMEYLINALENNSDFKHFNLDGQIAMVDDLLELKPALKERFLKLVKDGRIFIGPWYSQCDTQVIKVESVIRNIEYGTRDYQEFMKIGYLPDCFGQHSYLPSIFNRNGLKYSIFQRGVYNSQVKDSLNFNWVAPNKESIRTTNIFNGYGVAKFITSEDKYLNDYLLPVLDEKKDPTLLLPAGGDQYPIQMSYVDTCKELNKKQDKYEFILSNYQNYLSNSEFNGEINGELIACQKSRIHRTMHSQRMDIKTINNKLEKKIIEQYEPLEAMYTLATGQVVNDQIRDIIWKRLLVIQGHDGICSCNSDATNEDVKARLIALDRFVDAKMNVLQKKIAQKFNLRFDQLLLLSYGFNNNNYGEFKVITKKPNFTLSMDGNVIEHSVISHRYVDGGFKVVLTKTGESKIPNEGYYETIINLNNVVTDFGSYVIDIVESEAKVVVSTEQFKDIVVDNKIVINGATLGFEVVTDAGDSYDFAFVQGEEPLYFDEISNVNYLDNCLTYETNIINHQGVKATIKSVVTKTEDYKFTHKIINNLCDTRVRLMLNTTNNYEEVQVDVGLGNIIRPARNEEELKLFEMEPMAEYPLQIYPFERGIKVGDLTISNTNAMEYEVDQNKIYLTMFRSVGVLGRDDLTTRPGRASGINNVVVKTPKAQMLNEELTLEFVISSGNIQSVYFANEKTTNVYQLQNLDIFSNRIDRFILPNDINVWNFEPIKFELSGAFLSSCYVHKNQVIARLFNPSNEIKQVLFDKTYQIDNQKVTEVNILPSDYVDVIIREYNV